MPQQNRAGFRPVFQRKSCLSRENKLLDFVQKHVVYAFIKSQAIYF